MGAKERRLIEAMVHIKLNIAEIYGIFSSAVPEDCMFWSELAREKINQVALLKSSKDTLLSSTGFPNFPDDFQTLIDTKNLLFSLIANYSIEPPNRITAFETALIIEKSAIERSSHNYMRTVSHPERMVLFDYPTENSTNTLNRLWSYLGKIKKLNEIPAIVGEDILIVKDEKGVAGLLKEIITEFLSAEQHFDAVGNGKEGLDKITEKYYKLIISDIEMPVMDGIEFYNQASKLFPNINERFLFVTGDLSPDRLAFFKEHNIEFMAHPVSVLEISEKAQAVLLN